MSDWLQVAFTACHNSATLLPHCAERACRATKPARGTIRRYSVLRSNTHGQTDFRQDRVAISLAVPETLSLLPCKLCSESTWCRVDYYALTLYSMFPSLQTDGLAGNLKQKWRDARLGDGFLFGYIPCRVHVFYVQGTFKHVHACNRFR